MGDAEGKDQACGRRGRPGPGTAPDGAESGVGRGRRPGESGFGLACTRRQRLDDRLRGGQSGRDGDAIGTVESLRVRPPPRVLDADGARGQSVDGRRGDARGGDGPPRRPPLHRRPGVPRTGDADQQSRRVCRLHTHGRSPREHADRGRRTAGRDGRSQRRRPARPSAGDRRRGGPRLRTRRERRRDPATRRPTHELGAVAGHAGLLLPGSHDPQRPDGQPQHLRRWHIPEPDWLEAPPAPLGADAVARRLPTSLRSVRPRPRSLPGDAGRETALRNLAHEGSRDRT